jgi:REP element-mobilizing transposase RayT
MPPKRDASATTTPAIVVDWATLKIKHGDLPHWTCEGAIYHVDFRLADAIPMAKLTAWLQEREQIVATARQLGRELSEQEEKRLQYLYSKKVEAYLDAGHGECWLRQPEIASLVIDALRCFDGQRYRLHAWCVMPNHVHVVVQPLPGNALAAIIHGWKSFTAKTANRCLKRTGQFWQHEPYDHIIRSEKEYAFQIDYVWRNPDVAGITAPRWRLSASGVAQAPVVAGASCSGFGVVAGASSSGIVPKRDASATTVPKRDASATTVPKRDASATTAPTRDASATTVPKRDASATTASATTGRPLAP